MKNSIKATKSLKNPNESNCIVPNSSNSRTSYCGNWRKTSKNFTARKPFTFDYQHFKYFIVESASILHTASHLNILENV